MASADTPRSRRLFLAIALPDAPREELSPALGRVLELAPSAKRVPLVNLHITLRFLGATPPEALPGLMDALARAAAASRRFELRLQGSGSFGPKTHPTLLYAGLGQGAGATRELAGCVNAALGLSPDEGYTPHVSLARSRRRRGDRDLAAARAALADLSTGPFTVSALSLFESELSSQGSRYRILREARLPA